MNAHHLNFSLWKQLVEIILHYFLSCKIVLNEFFKFPNHDDFTPSPNLNQELQKDRILPSPPGEIRKGCGHFFLSQRLAQIMATTRNLSNWHTYGLSCSHVEVLWKEGFFHLWGNISCSFFSYDFLYATYLKRILW